MPNENNLMTELESNHKHSIEKNNMLAARIPGLIFILISLAVTCGIEIHEHSSYTGIVVFSILHCLFAAVYWYSNELLLEKAWLYFIIQGVIVYICAVFNEVYPVPIMTLYPLLLSQTMGVIGRKKRYYIAFILFMFCSSSLVLVDMGKIVAYTLIAIPNMVVLIAYARIFFNQVNAKIRSERLLRELEVAYKEVERLTLHNERQRMARDLHDTLAQGLVGLKMQLEATKTYLSLDDKDKAGELVNTAISRVSESLAEARHVIDDMRSHTNISFSQQVEERINNFTMTTGIQCVLDYNFDEEISSLVAEQSQRILSECLTNTAKHAHADTVQVYIHKEKNAMEMKVKDDGIGFQAMNKLGRKGHYGLLGIQERVRSLNGDIRIISKEGTGTEIIVTVPLEGEL
ncbi:sensor histidine kinase [Terribacillus sp. 179-K 1B1 HS]|uniref:sensor histidine kinase n=1 Tax=Terribacillus sp. 179-K 1B1 HS TaxID=3142388 RepID=UPI00399FAE60